MFFNSWHDLLRVLIVGVCAYSGLILLLRVTGKRTLSKMNAFDLVVTVALGSTLATVLLNKDVSLAEGLFAFAVLCGLQYVIAIGSTSSRRFKNLIKAEPTLLFFRGRFLDANLRSERVTQEEVVAAVRDQGAPQLSSIEAVVLETDGSLSVVKAPSAGETVDTLRNVNGAKDEEQR